MVNNWVTCIFFYMKRDTDVTPSREHRQWRKPKTDDTEWRKAYGKGSSEAKSKSQEVWRKIQEAILPWKCSSDLNPPNTAISDVNHRKESVWRGGGGT